MARRRETYVGGGPHKGRIIYGGDKRGIFGSTGRRHMGSQMRIYSKTPRRWPRIALIIALVVIFIACVWQFACGGLPFLKAEEKAESNSGVLAIVVQNIDVARQKAGLAGLNGTAQQGLDTQVTISAVGDWHLWQGPDFPGATSFNAFYQANGPAYFFADVLPFTSADNLTIANCEGTFTDSNDIQEKPFNFKAPAEYANVFVQGSVEAVNLANNHSFDYGTTGYNDTKAALQDAGITSFGYDRTNTYEVDGVKIGLFGVNELDGVEKAQSLMLQDIERLQKEGCAIIVGTFHWGNEGEYEVTATQVSLAHQAIDAGCDLVLGSHPHVLQGIEYYKQRYICYSLGNFCFGGNTNPMDYRTVIYQQTFPIKNGQIALGEAMRTQARVVPCLVSSSSSVNDYQPMPLSGDAAVAAIEALNGYSATLAGDGAEFSTRLDESGYSQVK